MGSQTDGSPPKHIHDDSDEPQHVAARQIITDLRRKTRQQCEHIMQLQRALCQQRQQHRADVGLKADQLEALATQLMLLESRLKRRQLQIAGVMRQREQTIMRQQKIIETLSTRLTDHGLGVSVLPDRTTALSSNCDHQPYSTAATDLDSLNDSDSAVVLDDIEFDWTSTTSGSGIRRDSNGLPIGGSGGSSGCTNGDGGVTIVRSISDAIDTNYKGGSAAYGKRGSCYLRRPEVLETVYSVEEDHEGATGDPSPGGAHSTGGYQTAGSHVGGGSAPTLRRSSGTDAETASIASAASSMTCRSSCGSSSAEMVSAVDAGSLVSPERTVVRQSHYNRVMSSNHRSVTKPKDVKYRRINKVKSKSLEELCGQLKQTDGGGTAVMQNGGCAEGHNRPERAQRPTAYETLQYRQQQQQQQQQQQSNHHNRALSGLLATQKRTAVPNQHT